MSIRANQPIHGANYVVLKMLSVSMVTQMSKCIECVDEFDEDDIVWVDPITTKASMNGKPYCTRCAPEERDDD